MSPNLQVCIVTQSHLCRNPRALKEAIALAKNGYIVHIVHSIFSQELLQQDLLAIQGLNIELHVVTDNSKRDTNSLIDRAIYKTGRLLTKYLKFENSLALGYGALKYYKRCKAINADLYICHQELAFYIGTKLINSNFKVAFDFEDWYSEDLLPQARKERPVKLLRKIETVALNKGIFCITTSNALARRLAHTYSCTMPSVIYNVFPSQNNLLQQQKFFSKTLKLFWFSQTIGPGRGLEEFLYLCGSLKNNLEMHLLGNINENYRERLKLMIPVHHQLYFHELVDEKKLAEKIAEFDIGLALELTQPLSRNYTITNKLFQYLQSGLPIIASKTDGQHEAFQKFKPGFKLSQNPKAKEVDELSKWLNNPNELKHARKRAIEAADFYNWEIESKKILNLVNDALEQ